MVPFLTSILLPTNSSHSSDCLWLTNYEKSQSESRLIANLEFEEGLMDEQTKG